MRIVCVCIAAFVAGGLLFSKFYRHEKWQSEQLYNLADQMEYMQEENTQLNNKISDMQAQIEKLQNKVEYMQMIPRYVGLRVYLFNYRGKADDANRILGEYRYQLQTLSERKLGEGKYTALELIHKIIPMIRKMLIFGLKSPSRCLA